MILVSLTIGKSWVRSGRPTDPLFFGRVGGIQKERGSRGSPASLSGG